MFFARLTVVLELCLLMVELLALLRELCGPIFERFRLLGEQCFLLQAMIVPTALPCRLLVMELLQRSGFLLEFGLELGTLGFQSLLGRFELFLIGGKFLLSGSQLLLRGFELLGFLFKLFRGLLELFAIGGELGGLLVQLLALGGQLLDLISKLGLSGSGLGNRLFGGLALGLVLRQFLLAGCEILGLSV